MTEPKWSSRVNAWLRRWVFVDGAVPQVVPELRDYPLAPRPGPGRRN